jgi:hypothetical protein
MFLLAKYGVQTTFTFPVVKRAVVDLAVSADWTPATGDTKVSKDGGNVANTTNNPAAVGGSGSALWSLTLTAAELQAGEVVVQIVDSATKAIEDQVIRVYTYGHASAKLQPDLSDVVRMGLTALPNAAAAANGGLPTVDATNSVGIRTVLKKNTALNEYVFCMFDETTDELLPGLTVSVQRRLDGGALSAGTISGITDLGGGQYSCDFAAADRNGNTVYVEVSAPGAKTHGWTWAMEP